MRKVTGTLVGPCFFQQLVHFNAQISGYPVRFFFFTYILDLNNHCCGVVDANCNYQANGLIGRSSFRAHAD